MKKILFIFMLILACSSAWAEDKKLICKYEGTVTMEESGFWLQSKQDKNWYKIDGTGVVKSYRPTQGEVCVYE